MVHSDSILSCMIDSKTELRAEAKLPLIVQCVLSSDRSEGRTIHKTEPNREIEGS